MSHHLSHIKYPEAVFLDLNKRFDFTLNVSNYHYRHMPVISGLTPAVDLGKHRVFCCPGDAPADIDGWFEKLMKSKSPSVMLIPLAWLSYSSDAMRAFLSRGAPFGMKFYDAQHGAPGLLALGFNVAQEVML